MPPFLFRVLDVFNGGNANSARGVVTPPQLTSHWCEKVDMVWNGRFLRVQFNEDPG